MIRPLKRSDFKAVIQLSMGLFSRYDETDFPFDEKELYGKLNAFLSDRKCYLRGMFSEGEIQAWLLAVPGHGHPHSSITAMTQLYYISKLKGFSAARAIVKLHQDLFDFAEKAGQQLVLSSSALPNSHVYCQLLAKAGWRASGPGRVTRMTKFHPVQIQNDGEARRRTRLIRRTGGAETSAVIGQQLEANCLNTVDE